MQFVFVCLLFVKNVSVCKMQKVILNFGLYRYGFILFRESYLRQTCSGGNTVEPRYNEVLGIMKTTLLYQVSHYIRVKKHRNIKRWDQQNYPVIRGFCYIRPLYNEVPL